MIALVDDEDYDYLNQWKWNPNKGKNTFYAIRSISAAGTTLKMHRVILKLKKGESCDHKDHNGLNNQRNNLRKATHFQNMANRNGDKNGTSKYKGVCKADGKWAAQIMHKGTRHWLGAFENEVDAALAYNKAAIKLHRKFAFINQV